MRYLYSLLTYLAAPLFSLVLLFRGLRDRTYWHNFRERFGFGPALQPPCIWVHAVSVGEVQAAAALVNSLRELYPDIPIVVTTFTTTGAARARVLFKDRVKVRYLPFDMPGAVRRFLNRIQPRIAVIFETELWPNLYHECGRRRVPLVLASARLSARSVDRYRRLGALFRETLAQAVVVAAQGEADASRFRTLGSDPGNTHVTGNLKFDFSVPADIAERGRALRAYYAPGTSRVGCRQHTWRWRGRGAHGGSEARPWPASRRPARHGAPTPGPVRRSRRTVDEPGRTLHASLADPPPPVRSPRQKSCCSTPWASCSTSTRAAMLLSSGAVSCRSAATTCWSRRPSACRF